MQEVAIPILQGMAVVLILGLMAVFIIDKLKPRETSMTSQNIQFVCPECGGHAFGSSQEGDGPLIRYCHGNDAPGSTRDICPFTWPLDEDWKFFTVYGRPVSKTQYAAAMRELQDELNRSIEENERKFPGDR